MERLKNIHIENYPFSTQEIPVLALIKLYLSQTNEPIKAIDTALSSRAGLEFLIEKAKASVAIKDEYSHDTGASGICNRALNISHSPRCHLLRGWYMRNTYWFP